jgi:hypothetical protein
MPLLHDPAVREGLKRRVSTLRPDSVRKWGTMSIDQMLHHVNHALNAALGREPGTLEVNLPLPKFVMKFAVQYLPWPPGSPTAREWISTGERYEFAAELARVPILMEEVAARPLDRDDWPMHTMFGRVGGTYWSRINAKHLDHHLRQFSA